MSLTTIKNGKKYMKKRRKRVFVICLLISMCFVQVVRAEEISGNKKPLDVIFVVDSSGSMKSNDPNRIALEMVKAFTDTIHTDNARVGYVAYNDEIVASSSLVSVKEQAERERLKQLVDVTPYRGNTDIGLGLWQAHEILSEVNETRDQVIVLISDGETDLNGSTTGRTLEQSNQDLNRVVESCKEKRIPIYTIALGDYSGNKAVLEQIASDTSARTYTTKSPELLIEVMYGILENNLAFEIQQFSAGRYSEGNQEISCILDEPYLNEINVLLISPQSIGNTTIQYGENQIPIAAMRYYAVGKITDIDDSIRELKVKTDTQNGQQVNLYVIGYRSLDPILKVDTKVQKNQEIPYQLYFKDQDETVIKDDGYYKKYQWNFESLSPEDYSNKTLDSQVKEGFIQGELKFGFSGDYELNGTFKDSLGSYQFHAIISVYNSEPAGSLPDMNLTVLSKDIILDLDDFFTDADGDQLKYSIESGAEDHHAKFLLESNILTITPQRSGEQAATILVSDGDAVVSYDFSVKVKPLWQAYWWVIAIIGLILIVIWKIFHKPEQTLEQKLEVSVENRFNGRLDVYFTKTPQEASEIPPLSFHLYKMKKNRFCLGELLTDYPVEAEQLGLHHIFMIADEGRKIILYHTAESSVMIGNSIACCEFKYKLSFGDVVYITSKSGAYELELRYISVIQ